MYVNATFTRETGYRFGEVVGRICGFLQGPDTNPADIAAMSAALDQAEPFERVVLNYRKDDSVLWYKLRVRPLVVDGTLRYFVGFRKTSRTPTRRSSSWSTWRTWTA